jgi:hypothetical protein
LPNPFDLSFQLGEVRRLNQILRQGGAEAISAYRELVNLLLRSTVMHEHGVVKLIRLSTDPTKAVIGGKGSFDPIPLTNGHYLRLFALLYLAPEPPHYLKVEDCSYQYQRDPGGTQWIFRYDYLRIPQRAHPPAHIQVRGELSERNDVRAAELKDIHFATGRVSLEAVIRTLIEQFHIPPRTEKGIWRPILTVSERDFLEVAHQTLSGPDH